MDPRYLPYDAAELVAEDAFIRWMEGDDPGIAAQWEAWLAAHPDRAGVVAEARQLFAQLQVAGAPLPPVDPDALWHRIEREAYGPEMGRRRQLRPLWVTLATAVAAVFLGFWLIRSIGPGEATVVAPAGERLSFVLPDSSQIHLNAGSSLRYPARRFTAHRQLYLEGEAFFAVEPGSRFVVETPTGAVEVLGTQFNVFSRDQGFGVTCVEGKVRVRNKAGTEAILLPGQHFETGPQGTRLRDTADLARLTGWMTGQFTYVDAPLDQVLAELGRQYALDLQWDRTVGQARYTGTFTSDSLAAALHTVCWPMGLRILPQGATYQIVPDTTRHP